MISPPAPPARARVLIATGSFLVGAGDLFLAPFALNARAQQNDVFLGNLFVGLLACLLGGLLVAAGLTGLGLRRRAAVVLALGQPLGAGLALALLGQIGVSSMAALSCWPYRGWAPSCSPWPTSSSVAATTPTARRSVPCRPI